MPPFASKASVQAEPDIPPFVIAVVGCWVAFAFLAVIIGLCLIIIGMCSAPHFPASGRQSIYACAHHHHVSPGARRGLTLPVASGPRCPECQKTSIKADKASRAPQASVRLLAPLPPYCARRGPTGTGARRVQPEPGRSTPSFAPSFTTPAMSSSPPLGYGARGSTASLHPVVW